MTRIACLLALSACGGPTTSTQTAQTDTWAQPVAAPVLDEAAQQQQDSDEAAGFSEEDPSLPEPPWASAPVAQDGAPAELLQAWGDAENRDWCAPVAPTEIGDARARTSEFAGGWSVEFDVRGQPGIRPNGRTCARCGRSAFGIAGTSMRVDEEDPSEAEERRFRDGSFLRLEPNEEAEGDGPIALVASIKIRGQDCLYQVWSLSGEEALDELVGSLRFVAVPESSAEEGP